MSQYSPLRDAFQELNKLLIDKQQWDAEHELRTTEMGLKKMQVESEMEDRDQLRVIRGQQVKEAQHAMEEVPVNIFDFIKNDSYNQTKLFDESNAGEQFARMVAGEKFSRVDRATGMVYDANGDPVRMSRMDVGSNAALANGVITGVFDPEDMINNKVSSLDMQLSELNGALKNLNPADISRKKEIKERIALVQADRNKHASNLSPDKLLPFYRQRMDIVDNLAVKAAASGARKDVLTALQHVSSKVHADYNTLLAKQMAREDREFKLKLKSEEAKSGNMKWAAKFTKDGDIVPGSVIAVNIPKGAGSSFIPEEVDGRLKDFRWASEKQLDNIGKSSDGKPNEGTAVSIIKHAWGRVISNPLTGLEQIQIEEANLPRSNAAISVYGQIRKMPKYKDRTESEVTAIANNAVVTAEVKFWNDVSKLVAEQQEAGVPVDNDMLDFIIYQMAVIPDEETKQSYKSSLGYIPNKEHMSSLLERAGKFAVQLPPLSKPDEEPSTFQKLIKRITPDVDMDVYADLIGQIHE